ncbi:hypothetical protein H181DRAFT_03374 [Streptomyces sp. WMMB 714]|uniref:hypothetical protein n=1 Tax=Streptomyces sp. WMMB 714 TaxID=1286822 RepID=UPI0005F7A277|nr:hypothetical protein [Streptomyces sp. WMMB 714]SCK39475.1 hypothetical protein H181DRAFT_03374 [Streptomyces sp. WMMB 714]
MTTGSQRPPDAAAALDFGDPLSMRSADDTDSGWGERTGSGGASGGSAADAAADLARFLEEKPPHHL